MDNSPPLRHGVSLAGGGDALPLPKNNGEALAKMSRNLIKLLALLLTLVGLLAHPTQLCAEEPVETAWKAAPSADGAEKAARTLLEKGQIARAANWIERMVRSPGLKPAQSAWAAKVRADLKWRLVDAGMGQLQINVIPTNATVTVDGKALLPIGSSHLVWLPEGGHQVVATATEHAIFDQYFNIVRGEKREADVRLALTRAPVLLVEAKPVCDVYIDQVRAGSSAKGRFTLTAGSHLVELRLEGFSNWIATLNFMLGDEKHISAQLAKKGEEGSVSPRVSNVDRPILDSERQDHGEVGPDLTAGPQVDSPISGRNTQRVAVERDAKGKGDTKERPNISGGPDSNGRTSDAPSDSGSSGFQVAVGEGAPSQPWSSASKGWMLAGPGLAMMLGGAYYALSSAHEAENVNETLAYGNIGYDAAYDKQAQNAYIGYAALGTGAVLTGWGSYYLFAKGGLSRKGRGTLASGLGLATLGAAAYVFLGAQTTMNSITDLPANHPEIDRRTTVAGSSATLAYGLGGAGAVVTGLGVYWLLSSGNSSSTNADLPHQTASTTSHFTLLPQLNSSFSGATLHMAW